MEATICELARSNTSSTGKVVVAALMTVPLLFPSYDKLQHIDHFHNENVVINRTANTGSSEVLQVDTVSFYKLAEFAKKFTQEQVAVPPEFNKFFQENFWDLLA